MTTEKINKAYYFSHDSNAHRDEEIQAMINKYGWEGYGFYWLVIERMSEATGYKLKLTRIESLATSSQIALEKFSTWIEDCINEYQLFKTDGESYWSESLIRRMDKKEKIIQQKIEAGKKGGEAKRDNRKAVPENKGSGAKTEDSKGNEINKSKEEESIQKKIQSTEEKEIEENKLKDEWEKIMNNHPQKTTATGN